MRHGDYGYDAPYAVVIFGIVSVAAAVAATICWREGETRVARQMTAFPDASFDLVVSSLAIHNIRRTADRRKAVAEGFRVLKPGGRMVVADIRATATYEDALRTSGASKIERRRLGWRFWWGNPLAATTLLTASKEPA